MVEAGAGSGRLARDILDAAQKHQPDFYSAIRLSLVEQSPSAREAQRSTLGPHAGLLAHSGAALPADVHGVIYANELLDALPTHVVAMTESGLREVFVDVEPSTRRFVERFEELSTPRIAEYLARAGAEMRVGWRAEVNLRAEDWTKDAANALRRGFMILIDYGHDERELYDASHSAGTLTSYKRHSQLADFLQEPGETDITAHVDLSAITRVAERSGLDVLARLDQTYFLLGLGHHRSRRTHPAPAAGAEDAIAARRIRQHAQGADLRKGRGHSGAERVFLSCADDVKRKRRHASCQTPIGRRAPRQTSRRVKTYMVKHSSANGGNPK